MNYETFENFNEVRNKIEDEGIEYFITNYCSANDMPDKKSRKLFAKAEKALKKFESYIYKKAFLEKYDKKKIKKQDKNFGNYACMEDGESQDFYNK